LLAGKLDADIVFIGTRNDSEKIETIRRKSSFTIINMAGKIELEMLPALIKNMDLIVTNDSGPMHIAAAVKTRLVAIFGPESPERYGPLCPDSMKKVIWKNINCSPCSKATCKSKICLSSITVEEVVEAAETLYKSQGGMEIPQHRQNSPQGRNFEIM
jgi:ADP-heptose:LPS heptosyltransferase